MVSKLAEEAHAAMIAAMQRLSPEGRLNAFLTHSRLMVELQQAGRSIRARVDDKAS
jgi:hypothetical protein